MLDGGPSLGAGPIAERLEVFRRDHDRFRAAVVNEPRGHDGLVGALLCEPEHSDSTAGVVFFNNVGYLGMCGHGAIGVVATLAHLGTIGPGPVRLETVVGPVTAILHDDGRVSVENVASWRKAKHVAAEAPGLGHIVGDVAWGGNWFYLIDSHGLALEYDQISRLTDYAQRAREAIRAAGFPEVDHVELFGPAHGIAGPAARSFVLCPGLAYDRSPCGTGTSAKLASLAADGKLAAGAMWTQQSIIGSVFTAEYRWLDRETGSIVPTITGRAFISAEATLRLDERDPFCWGIEIPAGPDRRACIG